MPYGGILPAREGLRICKPQCGRMMTNYCRDWKGIRRAANSIPSFYGWGDWALSALPKVIQLVSSGVRSLIPVQCLSSTSWRQTTQFCLKWHCSQVPATMQSEQDWWGGWSSLFGSRKCLSLRPHSLSVSNVWVNASVWSVSVETGREHKIYSHTYIVLQWRQILLINWTPSPGWGHSQNDFAAECVTPDEDKYRQSNGS